MTVKKTSPERKAAAESGVKRKLHVIFAVLPLSGCMASTPEPVSVTVCSLMHNSSNYDRKVVRTTADIESDGLHGVSARDSMCPERAIVMSVSNDVWAKPSVKPLFTAIFGGGRIGTQGKHIKASLVGLFKAAKNPSEPHRLILDDVDKIVSDKP